MPSGGAPASRSDRTAPGPESGRNPALSPARPPKLRSCTVCRSRKVRCDKQAPCSNCRRANIACVFPSADRPPRWVQRLDRLSSHATATTTLALQDTDPDIVNLKVMERLQNLENLVKELRGQLEQASTAAASSTSNGSHRVNSPESTTQDRDADHQSEPSPATDTSSVREQFGRLVPQDANRTRYLSSGFWSRVTDELHGLTLDAGGLAGDESDSSEDEASSSTQELQRPLSDRSAFLFRHNLSASAPELRNFQPLPSQIPFLLDLYSENVNFFLRIVHMPTLTKMAREWRDRGMSGLTPSNEALMFSIYYAAVTSMEDDDVMTSFGCSKADLSLKYRLGLEHALAKADFLHSPDIVLVQAFAIFLALARRHDSPMFVYMMTGLLVRMAQYLGLQRDGTHFNHLAPFEVEMRRKVWWGIYMLDLRASEDQGTDLTITSGSFDTKIPLNINDEDLTPDSKQMPTERIGITDISFTRIFARITDTMAQMTAQSARDGLSGLKDQSLLLNEIHKGFEEEYFQYAAESKNIAYWVAVTVAKITIAKMTLIGSLPLLFSSSSEDISDELRIKLLVSSIEVSEYNHALNAEQACRHWRWVYQSYSHWEAIVYLMIEVSRRPWSPIVERAWVALHSSWLIPARTSTDKNLHIWIPLRKLIHKSRRHRTAEINRLRADPQAAARLELEDQKFPSPSSLGLYPTGSNVEDLFRERWRRLVAMPPEGGPGDGKHTSGIPVGPSFPNHPTSTLHTITDHATQPTTAARFIPTHINPIAGEMTHEAELMYLGTTQSDQQQTACQTPEVNSTNIRRDLLRSISRPQPPQLPPSPFPNSVPTLPASWSSSDGRTLTSLYPSDNSATANHSLLPTVYDTMFHTTNTVITNLEQDTIGEHSSMDFFLANNGDGDEEEEDVAFNWYNWLESAKGMEWDWDIQP